MSTESLDCFARRLNNNPVCVELTWILQHYFPKEIARLIVPYASLTAKMVKCAGWNLHPDMVVIKYPIWTFQKDENKKYVYCWL